MVILPVLTRTQEVDSTYWNIFKIGKTIDSVAGLKIIQHNASFIKNPSFTRLPPQGFVSSLNSPFIAHFLTFAFLFLFRICFLFRILFLLWTFLLFRTFFLLIFLFHLLWGFCLLTKRVHSDSFTHYWLSTGTYLLKNKTIKDGGIQTHFLMSTYQVIFCMPKWFWGAKTCFTKQGKWYVINLIFSFPTVWLELLWHYLSTFGLSISHIIPFLSDGLPYVPQEASALFAPK